MIVLDEQLLGRHIEQDIAKWYRGAVQYIVDLRPHSIIKDDAIPELLRTQSQPTFVTINEQDFWRKVRADLRFCVVCFAIPDTRAREIPQSLRALLQRADLRTKARRMGKVIRVSNQDVRTYSVTSSQIDTSPFEMRS